MFRPALRRVWRMTALAAVVAGSSIATLPNGSARAQGLFEFLFGNVRRAMPSPEPHSFLPFDLRPSQPQQRSAGSGGPRVAFCVRLCDGRYFPIQPHANVSPAEACNSFCPAAQTKIFRGSVIDHAVAADGRRYSDLPNAFHYRDKLVSGCTCNGRDVGLAHIDAASDPTLRPGDIVATNDGLVAYAGRYNKTRAAFSPVDPARVARQLGGTVAEVTIRPRPASVETTGSATTGSDQPPARGRKHLSDRAR